MYSNELTKFYADEASGNNAILKKNQKIVATRSRISDMNGADLGAGDIALMKGLPFDGFQVDQENLKHTTYCRDFRKTTGKAELGQILDSAFAKTTEAKAEADRILAANGFMLADGATSFGDITCQYAPYIAAFAEYREAKSAVDENEQTVRELNKKIETLSKKVNDLKERLLGV